METSEKMDNGLREKKWRSFCLGIVVLLSVDIIWVASAELSEYIFHNASFNKPFFTTYFKTSMFTVYLIGFLFVKRWQYQLLAIFTSPKVAKKLFQEVKRFSQTDPNVQSLMTSENASRNSSPQCDGHITPPTFENMTDEDTSLSGSEEYPSRKVSFNHVREVRSLARKHGEAQVLARMSQSSINQLQNILSEVNKKLTVNETLKLSLMFVVLWMFATLMYQESLAYETAALTNILSSSSGIFTLLLAAAFPSSEKDKFSLSKLFAVLISFAGIFIVCWTDPSKETQSVTFTQLYALLGALAYACYLVLIQKKVGDSGKLDIPLFFGFVGLFGTVLFLPLFFVLHYTNLEPFEWPASKQVWAYLILNALVGTVLSELLWLWGCFLTSSLMATLSLGLVIPLTMAWDFLVNSVKFSWYFVLGTVPVFLSFFAICLLTHYGDWDPVKHLLVAVCTSKRSQEENKSLLNNETEPTPST